MTSPFANLKIAAETEAHGVRIWIGGDLAQARQVCREHCSNQGACLSVQPVDYIYSGGEETGICVTLMNYARFPKNHFELLVEAQHVATLLMERLNQGSFTLESYGVNDAKSTFYSRRKGD